MVPLLPISSLLLLRLITWWIVRHKSRRSVARSSKLVMLVWGVGKEDLSEEGGVVHSGMSSGVYSRKSLLLAIKNTYS